LKKRRKEVKTFLDGKRKDKTKKQSNVSNINYQKIKRKQLQPVLTDL